MFDVAVLAVTVNGVQLLPASGLADQLQRQSFSHLLANACCVSLELHRGQHTGLCILHHSHDAHTLRCSKPDYACSAGCAQNFIRCGLSLLLSVNRDAR